VKLAADGPEQVPSMCPLPNIHFHLLNQHFFTCFFFKSFTDNVPILRGLVTDRLYIGLVKAKLYGENFSYGKLSGVSFYKSSPYKSKRS
jgi:hypothetical protein